MSFLVGEFGRLSAQLNYVWDVGTLDWVPETQPGGGSGGTVNQGTAGVDPWLVTGTLTVDTTGLATGAKQDTGNTSLSSLDSKTPALGQALAAASSPVVLTALQVSALTPPAAITGFATSTKQSDGTQKTQIVDGSGNVISAISNALDVNIRALRGETIPVEDGALEATADGINVNTAPLVNSILGGYIRQDSGATIAKESGGNLATLVTKIPSPGQALAAASMPVVLPLAQITTLTPPAAITGYALDSSLTTLNAKDFATQTTLALLAGYVLALNKAQQAASAGVVGPLVQSLVNSVAPAYTDSVIAPLSLSTDGRVRTLSPTDEYASPWAYWIASEGPVSHLTDNPWTGVL